MSTFYVRVVVGDAGECFAEAWPEEFVSDDFKHPSDMVIEADSTYEAIHAGLARQQAKEYVTETRRFYDDHQLTLRLLGEIPAEHREHIHERRMDERRKMGK